VAATIKPFAFSESHPECFAEISLDALLAVGVVPFDLFVGHMPDGIPVRGGEYEIALCIEQSEFE
jgi:hypothetical protein